MRTTAGQFRFAQQLLSPNSISNDFLLSLARRHWMRYSILRKLLMLWYYGDRKTGGKVGLYETTAFAAKNQRSLIFVLRRPSRQAPLLKSLGISERTRQFAIDRCIEGCTSPILPLHMQSQLFFLFFCGK